MLRNAWKKFKRLFQRRPDPPDDPYSYVGVPKKPKPPHRSKSAAEEEP